MNLERAIEIAVTAHKGQVDKSGAPYILHPLRVMLSLESEEERIVAVLHDVVEDSEDWPLDRLLAEGLPEGLAAALESVLPRAGLRPFVSLTTPEKVAQLCELSNIVIGIRLFNRDIGKGGVGLESFLDIINHPARSLL